MCNTPTADTHSLSLAMSECKTSPGLGAHLVTDCGCLRPCNGKLAELKRLLPHAAKLLYDNAQAV